MHMLKIKAVTTEQNGWYCYVLPNKKYFSVFKYKIINKHKQALAVKF